MDSHDAAHFHTATWIQLADPLKEMSLWATHNRDPRSPAENETADQAIPFTEHSHEERPLFVRCIDVLGVTYNIQTFLVCSTQTAYPSRRSHEMQMRPQILNHL